jgi:tol-pal system protein YbgF
MKRPLAVLAGTLMAVVLSTTAFAASGYPVVKSVVPQQFGLQFALPMTQSGAVPIVLMAQAGASNNDALMLLLDQFQALRAEMEVMRGMLEEHSMEIRRLQRDSLDRYTDLDGRISALFQDMESGGAISSAPATTSPAAASTAAINQLAVNPSAVASQSSAASSGAAATVSAASNVSAAGMTQDIAPTLMTEQQLYELALDSLLQREEYQRSIQQFDQYLAQYPDGRFVTNAYYWKGQAFVNLSMFTEARDNFEVIITRYPDGRKIEDAMYSLGTVYHRLGDNTRSRQLLQDVRSRFPNTSAANLADIYLRSIN